MGINVEIDAYSLFKSGFQFPFQVFHKLCYLAIMFIVFQAIADEDVIFVTRDEACHVSYSF
jgi:hypothetical protein